MSKTESFHMYLAAWAQTQISSSVIKKIQRTFPDLKKAWDASMGTLESLELSPGAMDLIRTNKPPVNPEENWKRLEKLGISFVTKSHSEYPELLKEIPTAPMFLYAKGNLKALSSLHPVAVVGSRQMTEYGKRSIDTIVPQLVRHGITIVSGLAYGVDAYAHEVTLNHQGKAIAVLGCSVDNVYPVANVRLAKRIIESEGVIVSEYSIGAPPLPQNFPARNRIISGLSKGTIIIEAKHKSGSLITAQFALDQGRDVFVVPGDIFREHSEGTNHLLSQGAVPITSEQTVLDYLNIAPFGTSAMSADLIFESELERNIYNAIRTPLHIDDLALQLNIDGKTMSQTLSVMEMRGMVKNLGSMRYCRG